MTVRRWFLRVKSNSQVQEAVGELKQYVDQRFVEREISANTSEQAKAFNDVVAAMAPADNAVVLIGNLLVAKHTPHNGSRRMYAQSLSAAQLRQVEVNPGILASPERVLEMLALAMTTPQISAPVPGLPPAAST